ncbi:outer membrane beta-barrel protein [uncultured Nitratireductor sp.]|uniref:outer membrane protein n=1 Tax=uncultured Nitratireductor sp. TaxID=520953 RepID=UPI0026194EA1|nr:outer membrane beta-barrel protein [uncultured Nitratireductor sp.]
MTMRTVCLVSAVLFLSLSRALSAEPDAAIFSTASDWNGFYAGVQVGNLRGALHQAYAVGDHSRADVSAFFAGLHAGYQRQVTRNIVAGVELDGAWLRAEGRSHFYTRGGFQISPGYVARSRLDWTAALRGRLGYVVDRRMPYLAAGAAIADVRFVGMHGNGVFDPGGRKIHVGWTLGGGVDFAVGNRLILKSEYRYSDFGRRVFNDGANASRIGLRTHGLRLGASYRF